MALGWASLILNLLSILWWATGLGLGDGLIVRGASGSMAMLFGIFIFYLLPQCVTLVAVVATLLNEQTIAARVRSLALPLIAGALFLYGIGLLNAFPHTFAGIRVFADPGFVRAFLTVLGLLLGIAAMRAVPLQRTGVQAK